jgi:hypothetical protein
MPVLKRLSDGGLAFTCPGCGLLHLVWVDSTCTPCSTWNGDMERPTFEPDLRITWYGSMWHERNCCHFFVRDGRIEFCEDCTHEFAGQTLPMKEIEP